MTVIQIVRESLHTAVKTSYQECCSCGLNRFPQAQRENKQGSSNSLALFQWESANFYLKGVSFVNEQTWDYFFE